MTYIIVTILVIAITVLLVLKLNPVFGGNPTRAQKEEFKKLPNYKNGRFHNPMNVVNDLSFKDGISMLKEYAKKDGNRKPAHQLEMMEIDWEKVNDSCDNVTWLGHSTFLLTIDEKKILVDPMLAKVASPITLIGGKRYSGDILNILKQLPTIDAVLITHDHYDHLDYPTIKLLKGKVKQFFMPLGVDNHLIRWGVEADKIIAMNWWEEIDYNGTVIGFTPSQHFSGRSLTNRDTTLWGGWVIIGSQSKIFTSGDGGYGPHFKEIGEKYGTFDLVLMEGGQYNDKWSEIHMNPTQSVQASIDLNAKRLKLIHWGAFALAFHDWREPIEIALEEATRKQIPIVTSRLGETTLVDSESVTLDPWWRN